MWNSDYISEVEYLYGYYAELAPIRLKLALLSKGIVHSVGDTPNYLELGFGQGLSLNINAATSNGKFYGTDFNPGQAAHAQELAAASGKHLGIFDLSFEEFIKEPDLPQFDIIALHGIWSWVSDDSRKTIVDIIRQKLRPGGILYISYNVTPGWAATVPLRHLMAEYANRAARGGILSRVEQSIDFVSSVMDANAAFFAANPALRGRIDAIRGQDRNYIAHEYFNSQWDIMPFSSVSSMLAEAKLTFAASASILDNIEAVCLPQSASALLNTIEDPILRETTKDYFVNQQFRRDIYVRGPRYMTQYEFDEAIDEQSFVLIGDPANRPKKIATAAGEAELLEAVYGPVVSALVETQGQPSTVAEIVKCVASAGLTKWQVWEAMLILTSVGFVAPAEEPTVATANEAPSKQLNALICRKAQFSQNMQFLAAPGIGAAIPVGRIEQLFIHARNAGVDDVAAYVWALLDRQNQRLLVSDKAIESPEDNIAKLNEMLIEFERDRLPVLRSVGAV